MTSGNVALVTNKNRFLPDEMWAYMQTAWLREPAVLARLREETLQLPEAGFQISADQGQLMTLLVKMANAKRILEVGVFTGYSSICMALGLPHGGELVACDISEEFTNIARRFWGEAGVADKVRLILGPATRTLEQLREEGQDGSFDMAFIDADKPNYPTYIEQAVHLLRPGGVLLIDNVFWDGKVADPSAVDEGTVNMRAVNALMYADDRLDLAIIPIGDGLTIARKR